MSKIGEKIGKTIFKNIKRFGLRTDDITDMITEFGIDKIIAETLEKSKKGKNENTVLIGYYDNDEFKFRIVGLYPDRNIDNEDIQRVAGSYPIQFFGTEKQTFTLTELINQLITLAFDSDKKDK